MNTILDQAHTWFLDKIFYEDELSLILTEGKRGEPEELITGGVSLGVAAPIQTENTSRVVKVTFGPFVAWQCVSESYTVFDKDEVRDTTGFLQVITKSAYLSYVNQCHGWYVDIEGPAKHFRVWTEDNVVDVVSFESPAIELVNA